MSEYIQIKRYVNHLGLDLKSSDLTRPPEFSSGMLNAQYRKSGAIEKKKGYKAHAGSKGGHGQFTYNRINPVTFDEEPEALAVSNTVSKLLTATLSVTYSGADLTCLFSMFLDPSTSTFKAQIIEGTITLLDYDLGVGFDEASPVTITSLVSAINALGASFSASVTGAGATPAAFLKIIRDHDLVNSGALSLKAKYWQDVNTTTSAPLNGSEFYSFTSTSENATAVQLNNVMYFANGRDLIYKYDGQTLYRAGVPLPASISSTLVGGGAITGNNYFHKIQYIQKDAVGNFTEGNQKTVTTGLNAAGHNIDVTVANIVAGTAFNTNCAIVDGAQVSVTTITVDNGSGGSHTMKVGDTAYFLDSVSGGYVERLVTGVTASSITIDGAAVTVANNAVISNNLRIAIYRNKTSGVTPTVFYVVEEIPNNSFAATQVYTDSKTDASLGAQFIEPLTDRSLPPTGRYISSFRNQLIIAGNISNPNTVYYSDVDGPEYFPENSNQFNVDTVAGDIISGIAPNNEVFAIFKDKSIFIISGDIANNAIRVDQITHDIGCAAHATIKEIRGALYFLSDFGPRKMIGGQVPVPIGISSDEQTASRIDPVFDQLSISDPTKILNLKRAIGFNDRFAEQYILFLPAETITGGDRHTNSNSRVFVYDYTRDAWLEWDNLDLSGGITEIEGDVYFTERRYSSFNSSVDHIMYRRHDLKDAFDYADGVSPIEFEYSSQWESLGAPAILKRFLNMKLYTLEEVENNDVVIDVEQEANFQEDAPVGNFSFNYSGIGYGVSAYSTSSYGDPAPTEKKHRLHSSRARSSRFKFKNSELHANVVISGFEIEVATPYRGEMKKE